MSKYKQEELVIPRLQYAIKWHNPCGDTYSYKTIGSCKSLKVARLYDTKKKAENYYNSLCHGYKPDCEIIEVVMKIKEKAI